MLEIFGGPDRDRTDDLFHAMEARSQLRHRPTSLVGQLFYFRRSSSFRQSRAFCGMAGFPRRVIHHLGTIAQAAAMATPRLALTGSTAVCHRSR